MLYKIFLSLFSLFYASILNASSMDLQTNMPKETADRESDTGKINSLKPLTSMNSSSFITLSDSLSSRRPSINFVEETIQIPHSSKRSKSTSPRDSRFNYFIPNEQKIRFSFIPNSYFNLFPSDIAFFASKILNKQMSFSDVDSNNHFNILRTLQYLLTKNEDYDQIKQHSEKLLIFVLKKPLNTNFLKTLNACFPHPSECEKFKYNIFIISQQLQSSLIRVSFTPNCYHDIYLSHIIFLTHKVLAQEEKSFNDEDKKHDNIVNILEDLISKNISSNEIKECVESLLIYCLKKYTYSNFLKILDVDFPEPQKLQQFKNVLNMLQFELKHRK
jgi:hypothetical protein